MWILFAFGSALFAGLTAILAKVGIKNTDSNVATALRTIVVLLFSWIMVILSGSYSDIGNLTSKAWAFLVLSGLSTGASWLCYFRALQIGDINKVTPIDKSSTIITMILAGIFLGEGFSVIKCIAIAAIGVGTYLMIQRKTVTTKLQTKKRSWMFYAFASSVFASLTSILGKIGIEGIDSTLGTAIRTVVVLIMAWLVVFITKRQNTIKDIDSKSWLFLILSGFATGASWLCYYRALQTGEASIVVPIDKLSLLITIAFSYFIFHERLTRKAMIGLVCIVVGTFSLLL
ncbi:transporter family protein [Anaerosporobacter mobilis DSM 15930]|uniref:Transporter family protein n=1 Tax=Anaerosporobacter mobilis DSM 15930 TaxID=1120996 RepID=A0A1M7GQ50_9FIRM|nr:EamA family transporter [Anaerosporobacter mobilis]SHM18482.1 transporter family protein [Anaerosporobacter mobilis DSM 15930]